MTPAILFEPDGYMLDGARLMGRQAAGHGFLRAAVQARGNQPVTAYTPSRASSEVFRQAVAAIDPAAATRWIAGHRLDLLAEAGLLYRPDHVLGVSARQRLRAGPGAYALCGVTHTLAGETLDLLAALIDEPVMAWDALICTSNSAQAVVTTVLDAQADYRRWRSGAPRAAQATAPRPLLPVIPLGVHCADFAFSAQDRAQGRGALGLGDDVVAVLSAGRLSVNGKAHPYAMLVALQQVARETGKPLALIFAGQAFNAAIDEVYRAATATFCPDVQVLFVDGKDAAAYRGAWAAADLFISLADSIQETFGLTPVEAMAAGLPALVSDWNGYRDTVRDGVDGFRIATWAPDASGGESIAHNFEMGFEGLPEHFARSNTAVAVDMVQLTARLRDLVQDRDLRRRMGAAGQARARATYDWSVVFAAYQALWSEQTAIRLAALADETTRRWLAEAPRSGAGHMGPFRTFASYPTHQVTDRTVVSLTPGMTPAAYAGLAAQPLLARWTVAPQIAERVLDALSPAPATVAQLAAALPLAPALAKEVVARLAKLDVVRLTAEP